MPKCHILFYQETEEDAPVVEWLRELQGSNEKAYIKCRAALGRLAQEGHELRRPAADFLENGIHELRIKAGRVNYRLLYFFHERTASVVVHGLTKEDEVPKADIKRAIERKEKFILNPKKHTFTGEIDDENT
jgi:phage-related protein